ncbi:MAG TPA: signal peptidase I [Polyangiaceae bacterium]
MNQPQSTLSKRQPLVAKLLSLVVPGLGHFYLGRPVPALGLLVAHVALGSLATLTVVGGLPNLGALCLVAAPWCCVWIGGAIWAFRSARYASTNGVAAEYQRPYVYVLVGLLALPNTLGWTLAVRAQAAEMFRIPSASMLPGINPGSRIIVNKLVYRNSAIRRGDRVVFINPNARHTKYIKRVVALAGDVIEMQGDELIVNGRRLEYSDVGESASGRLRVEHNGEIAYPVLVTAMDATKQQPASFAAQTVPNGHCFLMGDNRHHSEDSRVHGTVPLSDVIGRVEWVF